MTAYTTTNERLSRLERMVAALHPKINSLLRAANIEFLMELEQMAEFSKLNAEVSKNTDLIGSIKTMADGLKAERDAVKAELDALKAADALDQGAVDAAEEKLAAANAALEALTAVATGTPAEPSLGGT